MEETTGIIIADELRQNKAERKDLENGKSGMCVDCGKEIPAARLEAVPESTRCVEDQRIHEARLRQGGGPAATH